MTTHGDLGSSQCLTKPLEMRSNDVLPRFIERTVSKADLVKYFGQSNDRFKPELVLSSKLLSKTEGALPTRTFVPVSFEHVEHREIEA